MNSFLSKVGIVFSSVCFDRKLIPSALAKVPKLGLNIHQFCDFVPIIIKKFDKIDRKILNHLQIDAALSVDQLAEKVHLSRNACWRRVKQLEQQGVIKKRVALIDAEKVDLALTVMVLIRTSNHETGWLAEFEKAVLSMPEIQAAHRMTGDLDYLLKVRVSDVKAYDRFYLKLIEKVEISDVSASFVMQDIKDTTILPV